MKAHLRSVRIAPKKASLIARMIRGLSVPAALASLDRTNKKGARIIEKVLRSAVANASHNDNQDPQMMIVKIITVNKAQTLHRGVPMARGRIRRMRKFLSHISVTLGFAEESETKNSGQEKTPRTPKSPTKPKKATTANAKNSASTASQKGKSSVESTEKKEPKKSNNDSSSGSSASSASSDSSS